MTIEITSALAALGWDAAFAASFTSVTCAQSGLSPARVVAEHRNGYVVADARGEHTAVLSGRMRHDAFDREDLPAVGDWVGIGEATTDGVVAIRAVLPRRGAFRRKEAGEATVAQIVAANVDVALLVTVASGDLNARRLERYLALAWESGALPVVVLTKTDLCDDLGRTFEVAHAAAPGIEILAVSALTGDGVRALEPHLVAGRTAVLLGPSGVGKSTLINHLLGEDRLPTSAVREDGKGRHTTTHRQLVKLASGGLLIDTPGMRELQLWSADAGLDLAFAEVSELARSCRFTDCRHETEPDCAVLAALSAGALHPDRLGSWRRLQRELAHLAARQDEVASQRIRALTKAAHREMRKHLKRKRR